MESAGFNYKPYITKMQGSKVYLDERQPYSVEGDWLKGAPKTGKGIIYAF